MRLTFLGGADGIGASCTLVELEGLRVVVDCGIRQARGETLPELRTLQDTLGSDGPHAILLTHAHLDHSGALPVLHAAWPAAPILTTQPTVDLVRTLLLDACRIMDTDRDEELPLYGAAQVEATLAAMRPMMFDDPVELGAGRVRFLPAGHILGAGLAVLEVGQRCVLVSGDISVGTQRTVAGMPRPRLQPDVVVVESTYGDRLHASRAVEERRLRQQVADTVANGGHVLLPAFAVGRAQEVLLVLREAMERGEIPAFPVYADGMVRAVSSIYGRHPAFLERRLRAALRRGDIFFPEGSPFQRVRSPAHRQQIMAGPPCCVVASSGMLAGGASPLYARAWATEPDSLIAVTGYQDEEAPGRALTALADGQHRTLPLPGGSVDLSCRVERYHLSAHADADEITALISGLRPRAVCVVHGDGDARQALAARLEGVVRGQVIIPANGESLDWQGGFRRRRRLWRGPGIGQGRPLDSTGLALVRDMLWKDTLKVQPAYTAEAIAQVWFGEDARHAEIAWTRQQLERHRDAFRPSSRFPFRFEPIARTAARGGPWPLAQVLQTLDDQLPADAQVYKRSAHQEEHRLVLSCHFPDVQRARLQPILSPLSATSGWSLEINPRPHQGALQRAAVECLGDGIAALKSPSLLLDENRVQLTVHPLPERLEDICAAFLARTGWSLELLAGAVQHAIAATPQKTGAPCSVAEAKAHLTQVFHDIEEPLRPIKTGFPGDALLLTFAHPGMARQHEKRLAELALRCQREVRIHPHPVHQRLLPMAQALVPESWDQTRKPGYIPQRGLIQIRVWSLPPQEEVATFLRRLEARCGCPGEVVVAQ